MNIKVKKLHEDAIIPSKNSFTDAGYDLYALNGDTIKPAERKLVSTGISLAINEKNRP